MESQSAFKNRGSFQSSLRIRDGVEANRGDRNLVSPLSIPGCIPQTVGLWHLQGSQFMTSHGDQNPWILESVGGDGAELHLLTGRPSSALRKWLRTPSLLRRPPRCNWKPPVQSGFWLHLESLLRHGLQDPQMPAPWIRRTRFRFE